jgi:hypothetical protein
MQFVSGDQKQGREWADFLLDILHKVKGHSLLLMAGMTTDRAFLQTIAMALSAAEGVLAQYEVIY